MAASGEAWQEGGLSLPQKALLRLVPGEEASERSAGA